MLIVFLTFISLLFAGTGWFEDYITVTVDGTPTQYYLVDANGRPEFHGTNFGSITTFSLTACDMKYWSDTQDRGGGSFFWMVTDNSGTPITEATEVIWNQSYLGGNNYQGIWSGTQNIFKDLNVSHENNTYQLHIWAKSWDTGGGQGDSWLNYSGGGNFIATFFIPEGALPITLAAFSAAALNGSVSVTWVTESESENAHFLLYRDGAVLAQIAGAGTSTEPQSYAYTDQYVIPGRTYTYQLADVSFDGEETQHPRVEVKVEAEYVDRDYNIGAAYPNPFNPVTVVPVNLAKEAAVTATLYDMTGRPLTELHNGALAAGSHALRIDGANLSTGIYFVRIGVNDQMHVQKIALMK